MSLREIHADVGFADGEIISCERVGSDVVVKIRAWNSRILRIQFKDSLLVLDLMGGDISGLYVHGEETELIKKA
ncbi:MAG TPA: hypothetical protein VHH73_07815, partial [Verrucomicrobiae bacterium]|nr:hypothetical protein [Verrucomicrobiae bacterium]